NSAPILMRQPFRCDCRRAHRKGCRMSIGAEFFLKMNTAAFTKGLATANNSIKDLKKELRESGGRRFVEVLGIAGIVKGFSAIINHAQETRKALEEMGKPISDNIASVARFGDAIDGLKGTAMEAGVAILGFFTGVGEKLGNTINELRNEFAGANLDISDAAEKSDRAANAQEGSRNKAYAGKAAANTPEHLRAKAKEADDLRRKNDDAKLDADGKLNAKLHERTVLEKQLSDLKKKDAQEQTMLPVAIATKELELTAQDAKITAAKDAATLGVSGKLNDLLQDREKLVRELNDLETKSAQAGKISAGAIADKNIELQKNRGEIISGTDAADAADEKKRKSEKAVAEANKKLHDFELDRFLPAT